MDKQGEEPDDGGFYIADSITKIDLHDGRWLEVYYSDETETVGLAIWDPDANEGVELFRGTVEPSEANKKLDAEVENPRHTRGQSGRKNPK